MMKKRREILNDDDLASFFAEKILSGTNFSIDEQLANSLAEEFILASREILELPPGEFHKIYLGLDANQVKP